MKYVALFTLGILTGLSFSRLPHYPLFRDLPKTPEEWTPKMTGSWSEDEIRTTHGYFNGGKN